MLILFCLVADLADADLVPETSSNAPRPVPRYVTWFLGLYCFKQVTMVTFKVFPRVVKCHNGYLLCDVLPRVVLFQAN